MLETVGSSEAVERYSPFFVKFRCGRPMDSGFISSFVYHIASLMKMMAVRGRQNAIPAVIILLDIQNDAPIEYR